MSEKNFKLIVKGRVQGVNFRNFAKQNASKLGIVGWARNLRNGNLEIIAQGDELKLNTFFHQIKTGPMMASVASIDKEEQSLDENLEFFDMRF